MPRIQDVTSQAVSNKTVPIHQRLIPNTKISYGQAAGGAVAAVSIAKLFYELIWGGEYSIFNKFILPVVGIVIGAVIAYFSGKNQSLNNNIQPPPGDGENINQTTSPNGQAVSTDPVVKNNDDQEILSDREVSDSTDSGDLRRQVVELPGSAFHILSSEHDMPLEQALQNEDRSNVIPEFLIVRDDDYEMSKTEDERSLDEILERLNFKFKRDDKPEVAVLKYWLVTAYIMQELNQVTLKSSSDKLLSAQKALDEIVMKDLGFYELAQKEKQEKKIRLNKNNDLVMNEQYANLGIFKDALGIPSHNEGLVRARTDKFMRLFKLLSPRLCNELEGQFYRKYFPQPIAKPI